MGSRLTNTTVAQDEGRIFIRRSARAGLEARGPGRDGFKPANDIFDITTVIGGSAQRA